MKSQSFTATIKKGSKELYLSSGQDAIAKNGAFVKIGKNEICYQIESYTSIELKKKFEAHVDHLILKGDYSDKIFPGDSAKLYFNETEALNIIKVLKSPSKSTINDIFEFQGGKPNGESASLKVTSLKPDGTIQEAYIESAGKYISAPENPVIAHNEAGETVEIEVEFDHVAQTSIFERDFSHVDSKHGKTHLQISYPFPKEIKEGDLMLFKKIIILDREYGGESEFNALCQTTSDFSPINKIPLMPPHCLTPHMIYNKGIETIDKRLLELEKEIARLKNRN
tara:strand:+ start:202 stop:1047 length:846 start_codon:yes stop_codon:yes gene_type:complete